MVTLTFVFNNEKVRNAGYTEDELLEPMRQHARKYGIDEIEHGVFAKDGNQALGALGRYFTRVSDEFLDYLDQFILNINGEIEDCKGEVLKVRKRNAIFEKKEKYA